MSRLYISGGVQSLECDARKKGDIALKTSKNDQKLARLRRYLYPNEENGTGNVVLPFILAAIAVACVGLLIYYICGPMEGYLHGDYTDTIYWANASFVSGKVISPDFAYAGILPFSANLWFIPLIAVFGVSMTAQKIGMVIFLLLFVAAIYFMCRSFKWSLSWTSVTVIIMTMLLSGSDKLREIMWGHVIYYSLALLLLIVGLGLVPRLLKVKDLKLGSIVWCVLSALFFCGVATNGFQIIALVTLPCMAVIASEVLLDGEKKLLDKRNIPYAATVMGIGVATVLGYALLKVFKGDIVSNYAQSHSMLAPAANWADNFMKLIKSYFTLIGVDYSGAMGLVSKESIKYIFIMLAGLAVIILPIILLFNYKKIKDMGTRMILIAHFTVSGVILFGYICGYLGGANWRMTPMLGTSILASIAAIKHFMGEEKGKAVVAKRIMALFLILLSVATTYNFSHIYTMPKDYGRDNQLHRLTEALEERGLEYGYATFWYSQGITLLSDSKVQTCMILADEDDGVTTDFYQNSYSWYKGREGVEKYFVLLNSSENSKVTKCDDWNSFVEEHLIEKEILFDKFVLYILDENPPFPEPTK